MTLQEELSRVDEFRCGSSFLNDYKIEEHKKQIFDSTRSKFLEFGDFYVIDKDPEQDEFYAICIVPTSSIAKIKVNAKRDENYRTTITLPKNSIFITVNNFPYSVVFGEYEIFKFKVIEKPQFGNGKFIYRAEITFSDTYYIDVFANNEQEAIDYAYHIEMPNWIHEWPEDPELDREQITRCSKWGKKMIRIKPDNE